MSGKTVTILMVGLLVLLLVSIITLVLVEQSYYKNLDTRFSIYLNNEISYSEFKNDVKNIVNITENSEVQGISLLNKLAKANNQLPSFEINKISSVNRIIPQDTTETDLTNISSSYNHYIEGQEGNENINSYKISFGEKEKIIFDKFISLDPVNNIMLTGVVSDTDMKNIIEEEFLKLIDLNTQFNSATKAVLEPRLNRKISVANISFVEQKENLKEMYVARITTKAEGCKFNQNINVYYDFDSANYLFQNLDFWMTQICPLDFEPKFEHSCTDCDLAPIDKENYLPASYIPKLTMFEGIYMSPDILNDYKSLRSDLEKKGIQLVINSAYRSFYTQKNTYNNWVKKEIDRGNSESVAKTLADNYSARPGHSEHQLGTTLDVNCKNCVAFGNESKNLQLYNFLENSAYKYGFVISYPDGKTPLTGYKYEGWHIRHIGVENATELYSLRYLEPNNGVTLSGYLMSKGDFFN